jgi:hypothetical protein
VVDACLVGLVFVFSGDPTVERDDDALALTHVRQHLMHEPRGQYHQLTFPVL